MIQHFRIGNPIETESVVQRIPVLSDNPAQIEEALCSINSGAAVCPQTRELVFYLEDEDIVYGLGESVRGMNKRGWIYKSSNVDEAFHQEETHSLYATHNFLLITSKKRSYALFVDTPGIVTFDIGYTRYSWMRIELEDFDANLYFLTGESCKSIVREFRQLIGKSYVPPKWAFGFAQSRFGYRCEEDVREIEKKFHEAEVPLDMICLDIDYMDNYKDFTVNEEAFPDFAGLVADMKEKGVRIIPIVDAAVKVEEGYSVYEEGVEKGYFCKKEDGSELTAAVWPGHSHLPDFLRPEVREWFGGCYKYYLDQGIEGFWNDMNEPSIFYIPERLDEVFDRIDELKGKNLGIHDAFKIQYLAGTLSNNPEDYKFFYQEYNKEKVRHDKVHNIYGFNMTRAAGEAFKKLVPDKKILLFSRSSCIGMHRYGGIWTGDNRSWWSHILLELQQMPSLNMCGFLFSGADTGGFAANCTEDLMLRWIAMSMFTPLFRNHAASRTREQEFYQFEKEEDFRNLTQLRYALIPYLYSEFMKAVDNDGMYMEPLLFEYEEDDRARKVSDQLLVGESIMIAPVYEQNADGRFVYLPEDMKLVRLRRFDDYDVEELSAGDHYIRAALNEVPVFLRKGKTLPLAHPALHVDDIDDTNLVMISYGEDAKPYELYAR